MHRRYIIALTLALIAAGCSQQSSQTSSSTSTSASSAATSAAATSGTTSNAAGGTVIKIGVDLPVSGADASIGVPTQYGAQLAVKQANEKHLVPGFTFEADVLDDAVNGVHDPAQGAKNIQSFGADPAVLGVVGPFNSNVARAEIPLSNSLQLALISPSNTNPTLTKGPDAVAMRKDHPDQIAYFRVCTTDDIQGPAGAAYEYTKLHVKNAYVVDDNETYGKGVADQWEGAFKKLGGTSLGHDHITKGQQDFHALLTRIANTHPDIVFFGGNSSTGGGLIRKQMPDAGLGSVIYAGADGISDNQFLQDAGSTADNVYVTVASVNAAKLPAAAQFLKDYQAEYNQPVGPYSANAYTAAMVMIRAIGEAVKANGGKAPTREQVLAQLRMTKDFPSVIGTFSFDANGDTTNRIISIYEAVKGKWVFVTQQNFAGSP
ncbi:MAG: branched-chain amino acid ABC transporter substrate-binding protein [Candidatus Eremiobacteraeota bacterium]|nr:branched-chain amino acid ABC transporter substrate-binding protein [Candidatus Eremiobacteraeota bacterium]